MKIGFKVSINVRSLKATVYSCAHFVFLLQVKAAAF